MDINSITRNEPVAATDNIYQFLMNAEKNDEQNISAELNLDILEDTANSDFVYMLDDGTQINASQIHFDNDDPVEDFNINTLVFIKRNDINDDVPTNVVNETLETKLYNIDISPTSRKSKNNNQKNNFASTLPFKVVPNKAKNFEAQVNKFLAKPTLGLNYKLSNDLLNQITIESISETSMNNALDFSYTREQVLDLVKDSPLTTNISEINVNNDIRRHIRKTDPSKPVPKKIENLLTIQDKEIAKKNLNKNRSCFICEKYIERARDKLYLFNKEDQILHRSLSHSKQSDTLKLLCENCLKTNFRPGVIRSPDKTLEEDECLVIKNNQQYIFNRITPLNQSTNTNINKDENKESNESTAEGIELVKEDIAPTEPANEHNENQSTDEAIIKEEYEDDFADTVIENLEEVDEGVIEFLGKCQNNAAIDMKCR